VPEEPLRVYRRRLPHFRREEATYFVTWRISHDEADLSPAERTCVADAIRFFDQVRYELAAWVVMNDHVHVVVTPTGHYQLEQLVQYWKSYTTHALWRCGRAGRLWQPEYMDRIVRNEEELARTVEYVLGNPQQRWPHVEHYPWVWADGMDDEI